MTRVRRFSRAVDSLLCLKVCIQAIDAFDGGLNQWWGVRNRHSDRHCITRFFLIVTGPHLPIADLHRTFDARPAPQSRADSLRAVNNALAGRGYDVSSDHGLTVDQLVTLSPEVLVTEITPSDMSCRTLIPELKAAADRNRSRSC